MSTSTYGADLSAAPQSLRSKIEHSVALLRRAEQIALAYDPTDGFFLAFSGGKDSQALYHIAKLAGVRFRAHMSPTTVDPPEVIRFVRTHYPDVEIIKPKQSIYQAAIRRGSLPTRVHRWCCYDFKEGAGAGRVTLTGIRHEESYRRSLRGEVEITSHLFKGTLDGLETYRKSLPDKKQNKAVSILNADGEHVSGCIHGKDSLLIAPIITWTERDVWTFLNKVVRVPHCSLYDEDQHRIGCIMCPMARPAERAMHAVRWPHSRRRWIDTIIRLRNGANPKSLLCKDTENTHGSNTWKQVENVVRSLYPSDTENGIDRKMAEIIFAWWLSDKSQKEFVTKNVLTYDIFGLGYVGKSIR